MNKQKMTIIIICTVLAMILVAVGIVMLMLPGVSAGGKGDVPGNGTTQSTQTDGATNPAGSIGATDPTGEAVQGDKSEEANKETKPTEKPEPPTVGIEVEDETIPENGGNRIEIDFEDLLG